MSKSILYDYSPDELQILLDTSDSYSALLRRVGLNPKGGNPKTLKKIIKEYNLDETQLNINRSNLYSRNAYDSHIKQTIPLEDIFNGKAPNYHSSKLLERLIKEGYKEMKCEICGVAEWMGKPLKMHLHHKDGVHINHKLENLQVLCPNCHSQTESFAGRNKKNKPKKINLKKIKTSGRDKQITTMKKPPPISKEELYNRIQTESFVSIGKDYNVTDNTVRKWCDKYDIPRRKIDLDSREIEFDVCKKDPLRPDLEWKPLIYKSLDLSNRYYISNYGDIYSINRKILMKTKDNESIVTSVDGSKITIIPSIAVAYNFVEGYIEGSMVKHIDNNKNNNYYLNLKWISRRCLTQDGKAVKVKCMNTGEVFDSMSAAIKWCGLKSDSSLREYFNIRNRKTCGKHPKTGERLKWELIN